MPIEPVKMLRLAEVETLIGLKRSAIYTAIAEGRFPKPLRVGPRVSAWRSDEIASWQDQLPYADKASAG